MTLLGFWTVIYKQYQLRTVLNYFNSILELNNCIITIQKEEMCLWRGCSMFLNYLEKTCKNMRGKHPYK